MGKLTNQGSNSYTPSVPTSSQTNTYSKLTRGIKSLDRYMARNNLPHPFPIIVLFCLLVGCSSPNNTNKKVCITKHEVYLGVTNISFIDTLANAKVYIDDSLTFNQNLRLHKLSSTNFQKLLHLCEGKHLIKVQFGRYSRDTTMVINSKTSLIVNMDYETAYPDNNGVVIVKLERDSDPKGTAPD